MLQRPVGRPRTPRAASKEALKQMNRILSDKKRLKDVLVLSDDEDIVEVQVPPKKKYKVSKKSEDDDDSCLLDMEFAIEELCPAQLKHKDLLQKEEKDINEKLELLLKDRNADIVYSGVFSTALEVNEQVKSILNSVQQPVSQQPIVLQSTSSGNSNTQSYQLVMDPRLGVIVGAMPTTQSPTPTTGSKIGQKTTAQVNAQANKAVNAIKRGRGQLLRQVPAANISPLHKVALQSKQIKKVIPTTKTLQPVSKRSGVTEKQPVGRPSTSQVSNIRPSESTVEGGLNTDLSINLTETSKGGRAVPDSREVSFNKLQGRTYPSLVVIARPHLRVKDLAVDRAKLDLRVKNVLLHPPTKFTEWLIQQGLVRSEQKCLTHANRMLKLGMYSDATKFLHSGGYVWISECCPARFVSVFNGSIFEGSQHPPVAVLKLLYHWCCQTIVQNVTQWVKVDNLFVKNMYTWLRAVCSVAIQSNFKMMGGYGAKVQIGVISLGTTSQDGNKREVKVEVLGVLEMATRQIRLRAIEPLPESERNYKKRFAKILEPVLKWVHPGSHIITDLTVDKNTLLQMGFAYVTQGSTMDYNKSNRTIMEYLRRIVPRMFQSALSLLSRSIIQQFLDELVWREWYGTTVNSCFENIIKHVSEQTRHDTGVPLITRLNKVSIDPFAKWEIAVNNTISQTLPIAENPKRYTRVRKPVQPQPLTVQATPNVEVTSQIRQVGKSVSPELPEQIVPLENYYYGCITNFAQKTKMIINIKCPFCNVTFATNILLMNHLFQHAHNFSSEVQLCRYCLTIVPDGPELLKHITSSHPDETKFNNNFVCLICEEQFRNPFILGKHMSREHVPAELPYNCGTCTFRCSNHKQAIDHFYHQHDNGTTIQCPFCLKSTTVHSGGRNITQNINFFVQHLQKHQKKYLAKKCNKCSLWFVQKEFLKYHQTKMHISLRGKNGLVPNVAPRNGVMVPKSLKDKSPDEDTVINFSTLKINIGKNLNCKECGKTMMAAKHFTSYQKCKTQNCTYSTCCSLAMLDHESKCSTTVKIELPEEKLPYRMYCICGFNDDSGNKMAKHLTICERKSAYPSITTAKKATVTHSIMDVLGLVRKPDEIAQSSKPTDCFKPIILKALNKDVPKEQETRTIDLDKVLISGENETIVKQEKDNVLDGTDQEKNKDSIELPVNVENIKSDEDIMLIDTVVDKNMNASIIDNLVENNRENQREESDLTKDKTNDKDNIEEKAEKTIEEDHNISLETSTKNAAIVKDTKLDEEISDTGDKTNDSTLNETTESFQTSTEEATTFDKANNINSPETNVST